MQAFAAGELERTISLTEQALAINPRFEPAEETRTLARRMLELQGEMEAIRLGEEAFADEDLDIPHDEPPEEPESSE